MMRSSEGLGLAQVFGHDRVAVLDGGLPAWCKEGYPVESGPAVVPAPGHFAPAFRPELVKSKDQMLANALSASPGFQVCAPEPWPAPHARVTSIPGNGRRATDHGRTRAAGPV
jgi:thiosulfate/3-mercaptopyruvate sulfurtransferase